jgi:hypothetical protein
MTPMLRPALGAALVLSLLLAALPLAQADGSDDCLGDVCASTANHPPGSCVYTEQSPEVYVAVDPTACAGVPLPVLPGMEASCAERERHPSPDEPRCCEDGTPEPPCCGMDEPCCEHPSCCHAPGCCNRPACCQDIACCQGDLGCLVRVARALARYRIGQELILGLGVCVDFGQRTNGTPYASVDTSRSCVRPPD